MQCNCSMLQEKFKYLNVDEEVQIDLVVLNFKKFSGDTLFPATISRVFGAAHS